MSEAQAAMGLLSLEDYAVNRAHNRALFDAYRERMSGVLGMRVIEPAGVNVSNHQALVCEVDERFFGLSRDALIAALAEENVEARAISTAHGASQRATLLPASAHVGASWLALPLGAHVSKAMVDIICEIVAQAPARERSAGAAAGVAT